MNKLTKNQLIEKAGNKLEAKIFFQTKEVEKIRLMQDGVIDYGIPQETICNMLDSAEKELQVLEYIKDKLND
jgi:hypothetical protein